MRAVITVIGKDNIGILGKISSTCAKNKANIIEVNQNVMQDLFTMMMLIEINDQNNVFTELSNELEEVGKDLDLVVKATHEDLFNTMHKI